MALEWDFTAGYREAHHSPVLCAELANSVDLGQKVLEHQNLRAQVKGA
jgi:hypothetical protein